jgi:hypothetical protein
VRNAGATAVRWRRLMAVEVYEMMMKIGLKNDAVAGLLDSK